MIFGLSNSPATFQTMMNDIFKDLIDKGHVAIYMDDILIYTRTIEHHWVMVTQVLDVLWRHRLYLKAEKCSFECSTIEYLGLVLSEGCIEMDPIKIASVWDWTTPKNVTEVQSFVGFVNFYRRFIPDFSHVAGPLHHLTKKEEPWQWAGPEESAFVMITIDFGTHLVAIRWRSKGTQLFRQQCCRVIYTSKGPCR